jgi:hypothetical protein
MIKMMHPSLSLWAAVVAVAAWRHWKTVTLCAFGTDLLLLIVETIIIVEAIIIIVIVIFLRVIVVAVVIVNQVAGAVIVFIFSVPWDHFKFIILHVIVIVVVISERIAGGGSDDEAAALPNNSFFEWQPDRRLRGKWSNLGLFFLPKWTQYRILVPRHVIKIFSVKQGVTKMGYIYLLVYAIFVVIGAFIAYIGIRDLIRAKASVAWPTSPGKVLSSSVVQERDSDGVTEYHAEVVYEFNVNNSTYSGKRISYGGYRTCEGDAQEIVNRYPQDKNVTVHYMPNNPKECLLEVGVKGRAYIIPAVGLSFVTFGILMAVFYQW